MMEQPRDTLIVRITRISGRLGMSAFYNRKSAGSVPYKEIPSDEKEISVLCEKLSDILTGMNSVRETQSPPLSALKEAGRKLFETIFTDEIKERIRKAGADYLVFSVDDALLRVPWELLHDGREFLCLRFAMSRSVGHREFTGIEYRETDRQLKALVLAPASPHIGMTYNEGIDVINELYASEGRIKTSLQIMEVGLDFVKSNIKDCDIVHFVGQVDYGSGDPYNSGWVFNDGILTAGSIRALGAVPPFPSFIFSDAVQRGEVREWAVKRSCLKEALVPAAAILSSGVKHYIETFRKIPDEARLQFVKDFYSLLMAGERIGEAMRLSRMRLIEKYSAGPLYWAFCALYGDPAMTVFEESIAARPAERGADRRRSALFGRRASDKIKAALLIITAVLAVLGTDRLFRLTQDSGKKDKMVEEIGAGLKYMASLKQERADAGSGFSGLYRYEGPSGKFDWARLAFNIHQAVKGAWAVNDIAPSLRTRAPVLSRMESAVLYDDIFSLDQNIYFDALAGSSIRSSPGNGGVSVIPRIKDRKARKYFNRAKIKFAEGEYASSLKYAQKAFELAWMMDDRRDESATLILCYAAHTALKQERAALACMLQDKAIADKFGDAAWEAKARFNLGLVYCMRQNTLGSGPSGVKDLERALKTYRSLNDTGGVIRSCIMLGYAHAQKKEYAGALASIDDGLKAAVKSGDTALQGLCYKALGDIHCSGRKYAAAQVYYGESLIVNRPIGNKENSLAYLDALYRMAFLNLALHDRERAWDFYDRIVRYLRENKKTNPGNRYKNIFNCLDILIGQKDAIPRRVIRKVYMEMAICYFKARDYKMADRCLDRALK